ncbi:hypothetical protein AB4Z48_20035 [Cupriavidus sp. 2TAF22]|uniref:hypothetical protein n=1 Tax=unclassified Cupriavidus TaxID=2640874 RepID=UPI003F931DA4
MELHLDAASLRPPPAGAAHAQKHAVYRASGPGARRRGKDEAGYAGPLKQSTGVTPATMAPMPPPGRGHTLP